MRFTKWESFAFSSPPPFILKSKNQLSENRNLKMTEMNRNNRQSNDKANPTSNPFSDAFNSYKKEGEKQNSYQNKGCDDPANQERLKILNEVSLS
jgi:hypothetical protein